MAIVILSVPEELWPEFILLLDDIVTADEFVISADLRNLLTAWRDSEAENINKRSESVDDPEIQ